MPFIVDDGKLPFSVAPLYVATGEAVESAREEKLEGLMWRLGTESEASYHRKCVLTIARKNRVSLKRLCKSLRLKWAHLTEAFGTNIGNILSISDKKHSAWYDEIVDENTNEELKEMLEIPKNFND